MTNFRHGPGAMPDDKAPYQEGHGQNCYGYIPSLEGNLVKAHKGFVTTSRMTYKKDKVECPVEDQWIIVWTNTCTRTSSKDKLKRSVTYFQTKNQDFLWVNSMAIAEFQGIDSDEFSSKLCHGNMFQHPTKYQREDKQLLRTALEMRLDHVPARKVYRKLKNASAPSKSIKQSRQIYDQLAKHKQKEDGVHVFGKTANDQILQAYVEMQTDKEYGNFIKYFFVNDKGKPGIICFQEWQIAYTKRMCAFNPIKCSIMHTDKTYNCTFCNVTHYAFETTDYVLAKDNSVHPIIPGAFLFHADSTTDTFNCYHERLSSYLRIDNKAFEYDYIKCSDRERALKESDMANFSRSLHTLCCKHLHDNLCDKCIYSRDSREGKNVESIFMDMAGADSLPEFHAFKEKMPKDAFKEKKYFENFAKDVEQYVVIPRLKQPKVIPKYLKTNIIESSNNRIKREIEYRPQKLKGAVGACLNIAKDTKDNMIMAHFDKGDWRIAPFSKLKRISEEAWEQKSPEQQEKWFLKNVCQQEQPSNPNTSNLVKPQLDTANMSSQDRKAAIKVHNQKMTAYNNLLKDEMLKKSVETGIPQLNISNSPARKPGQTGRSTCNMSQVRPNRYVHQQ